MAPPAVSSGTLMGHYDASVEGYSDGTQIGDITPDTRWHDQSGNGFHLSQGTSNLRPIFRTGLLNGLPMIRFDGTGDRLFHDSGATGPDHLSAPTTRFVVLQASSTDTTGHIAVNGHLTSNLVALNNGVWYLESGATVFTAAAQDTNPHFVTYLQGLGSGSGFWLDGTEVSLPSHPGDNDLRILVVGSNSAQNGAFWEGDMGEIIVYEGALSDEDRLEVESYLAEKWGFITSDPLEDDFTGTNGDPWNTDKWDQDAGPGGGDTTIQDNKGRAEGSSGNGNSGGRGKGKDGFVPNQKATGTLTLCQVDEPCRISLWLQASNDWEDLDNPTDGYGVFLPADSDTAQLVLYFNGNESILDTASWPRDTGEKSWEFRRQNNRVRFRIWDTGDEVPDWLLSANNSTLPIDTAGTFQVAYACPTAPSVDACVDFDDVNVGEDDTPITGGSNRMGGVGAIRKPPR